MKSCSVTQTQSGKWWVEIDYGHGATVETTCSTWYMAWRTLREWIEEDFPVEGKLFKDLLTQLDGLQEGSMEEQHLYQDLIDREIVWYFSSKYRRRARWLVAMGKCTLPWRERKE